MPIKKLKNGSYKVDISVGVDPVTGRRRRKTRMAKTKKEAEELYIALKHKYNSGLQPSQRNLSFNEVIDIYLDNCKLHNKPNYYQIQLYTIDKHITPHFINSNIKKLTHTEIRLFQKQLIDTGLSNKTVNNIMIILKKLFDTAINEKIIDVNPCDGVPNLSIPKKQMKFWTPEQFKAFIKLIDKNEEQLFKIFYTVAYFTGMRCGELLALTWNDIDSVRKEINVYKSLSFIKGEYKITPPKTKNSNRRISINTKLLEMLLEWKEKQKDILEKLQVSSSENTFIFQYKESPANKDIFSRKIKTICARGEVEPIRLHDLRHSHVALLIHQREDYITIKERLGHASIKTTIDVYGHLFPNKQKETADKLDELF
ncbi:tyrosine-type recombinase/integrase [Bacillus spizizenii]|nr:site-specific integrase [Bacillus spizizenii]MCY8428194.1 site-specific integrase [Bacillus spizizenii]MCY8439786.1 site-specific integrase [Bacillus spizizenii]MCY8443433.1 site-specific integrase [Bacillus spizizenii]MCY8448149.1 site-specific integrase [Bacillus spizizenii]